MASPLTSSQFTRLLDNRLREVGAGVYKDTESMIPKLYRILDSDSAWEEFYNLGDVQDIPEFNGKMSLLGMAPGYHTKIEPLEYGAALNIERKLIDDKKYAVMDNFPAMLMKAAMRTREKKGALAFVNAFSAAYDYMTSEEGVALCSDSHTTKSGTSTATGFDNAGSSALSKTSVAATRLLMRGFRSDISELIQPSDKLALIVPDNLADLAHEIMGTPSGLDTAESNVNVQYKRHEVIPYLRLDEYDTNNWFMVDRMKMKEDLVWIDRVKPEIDSQPDFMTKMMLVSVYFRIAYGFKGWRWIYGHNVS